jgi:hypothetical protein
LRAEPIQFLEGFVLRWRLEGTWQEARAHWGLEIQRQWHAKAIARAMPPLLGLVALVPLLASPLAQEHALPVRQTAWHRQSRPPVVEAIAIVRQHWWPSSYS